MLSRLAQVTFILLTILSTATLAEDRSISVLVNSDVKTEELTPAQLRKIFSMRQTVWPDGQPISVFVLKTDNPAHQALCKDVLKMFPYQIERLWNKLAYSGLGDKPKELKSTKEMLKKLRSTPGAIGYVLDVSSTEKVKKIKVIGE
ncbi:MULTISPECIES: hypothetical protein [Aliiglaciecola]|uniref:hypothetical protein n=1 Tax=Aliiglaciecola TaxID=1406885 RepID=UPI001C07FAF9|nr:MULTISPECIES: hypothetical protein [Aliiglaciecola]MBU2879086.1 hypothetical protein [Aliiglaciecola lipolytica]MDO6710784.1 hypothetical protein [Aliiglaciecola sp. 2_MG-2023]